MTYYTRVFSKFVLCFDRFLRLNRSFFYQFWDFLMAFYIEKLKNINVKKGRWDVENDPVVFIYTFWSKCLHV